MPMIDVTAAAGTFSDQSKLARDLAQCMMRWEAVPDIPFFADNTAAFVHELAPETPSNASGDHTYVRISVLTPAGVLDRIPEAPDGGWGIDGHAFTNAEIAQRARKILAGD